MSILHLSINAGNPERVARFLAFVLGGRAMPFPPFPNSWVAFTAQDDGSAIEVYPLTHALSPGKDRIACDAGNPVSDITFVHAAIASPLGRSAIIDAAEVEGWLARLCNRGPFECVEVWLEDRLLVEVLDPEMREDYRRGMTAENWAHMFGLE